MHLVGLTRHVTLGTHSHKNSTFTLFPFMNDSGLCLQISNSCCYKQGLILNGEDIKRSSDFCYLGSIVTEDGGTRQEVNVRIQKERGIILQIKKCVAIQVITKRR